MLEVVVTKWTRVERSSPGPVTTRIIVILAVLAPIMFGIAITIASVD